MSNRLRVLSNAMVYWPIITAGGIVLWFVAPGGYVFEEYSVWGVVILTLGIVNWLYISTLVRRVHPKSPKGIDEIERPVTQGVYAVIRHPLYVADIILACSVFLFSPSYKVMAVVLWMAFALLFLANLEEWLLEEKFMEEYSAYKKRVPMFFPGRI